MPTHIYIYANNLNEFNENQILNYDMW